MNATSLVEGELAKGRDISAVSLLDALVRSAHAAGASDIHIDPEREQLQVRLRIDGMLHDTYVIPERVHAELLARLKVLAGLPTDEHQAAQDGRFRFALAADDWLDVRLSIAPTYHGENVVLRLLAPLQDSFTLPRLGLDAQQLSVIQEALARSHGLILATGPTGAGKTTMLYACIAALNTRERAIVTIEDPIEYSLSGINQIPANERAGLSFARGLRSILRQDPDIIMVGEIRDDETARLAVNAALTGHLVLSTLHTNDAPTALPRLREMGVEPYLIASTVTLIVSQRLLRRVCNACARERTLSPSERQRLSEILPRDKPLPHAFKQGAGCEACRGTGYAGRIGAYEVLPVTDALRELLAASAPLRSIRAEAAKGGMRALLANGYEKALLGLTSIEEVLRMPYE